MYYSEIIFFQNQKWNKLEQCYQDHVSAQWEQVRPVFTLYYHTISAESKKKKKVPRESPGLTWEECLGSKRLGCPVIMLAVITGLNTVTAELRHWFLTSLSSKGEVVVITPVSGCMEKCLGWSGICCRILNLKRVCRVPGSSLSMAVTCPTEVPV